MIKPQATQWHNIAEGLDAGVFVALQQSESGKGNDAAATVPDTILRYIASHVIGRPWANHLALAVAVLAQRGCDSATIRAVLWTLHPRFVAFFEELNLQDMGEWDASAHLQEYWKGHILPDDTPATRIGFVRKHNRVAREEQRWLDALPKSEQAHYQPFVLPLVHLHPDMSLRTTLEIAQRRQAIREAESEAMVPHLRTLRDEAQRRYQQLTMLYRAYGEAQQRARQHPDVLPLPFSYEENMLSEWHTHARTRLHFRIWDRRSFVLEHADVYRKGSVREARKRGGAFAPECDSMFLEFVHAEPLSGQPPPEPFWFTGLLRRDVLGRSPQTGNKTEHAAKQAWLRAWGYSVEDERNVVAPFTTEVPGLLVWPSAGGTAKFVITAQERADGLLVPIEQLYAGATFGMLALHLFARVGMHVSEVAQVRLTDDCFVRLGRGRMVLRVVPQGKRAGMLHDYCIDPDTVSLLQHVAAVLRKHYELPTDASLPMVAFDESHFKAQRFEQAPYLLQYDRHHVSEHAVTACLRFLLHGLTIRTVDDGPLMLTAALRNAFATQSMEAEQISAKIGSWLHQKRIPVSFGKQPTTQALNAATDRYRTRMQVANTALQAFVQLPPEVQQLYNDLCGQIGGDDKAADG